MGFNCVCARLCCSDRPGGAVPVPGEGDVSHGHRQQLTRLQVVLRGPGPHGEPGGAVWTHQPGAAPFPHRRAHRQRQAAALHQPPAGRDGPRPHPGGQRPRHLRRAPLPVQGLLVRPLCPQPDRSQPDRAPEEGQTLLPGVFSQW